MVLLVGTNTFYGLKDLHRHVTFLPKFDVLQRKQYADIAIGESLDASFYEPLHSSKVSKKVDSSAEQDELLENQATFEIKSKDSEPHFERNRAVAEKATYMFQKFCSSVTDEIKSENKEFNVAMIKFM